MTRFRDIHAPLAFAGGHETLLFGTIARRLHIEGYTDADAEVMDLDPEYQRGHVWTPRQQEAFVGHMLEGGATPVVIFNRDAGYVAADEIVDGKQRITAIGAWIQGKIAAELTDGTRVYLRDFTADDQRQIMGISGPHMQCGYVQLNRAEVLRLYLRLNRGGTVHTDAEINRVRDLLAAENGEYVPGRCMGRGWVRGPKGAPGRDWVLTGYNDPAYAPKCKGCEDCHK